MRALSISVVALIFLAPARQPAQAEPPPGWSRASDAQRAYAKSIGKPVAFENHLGMRFVLIPPRRFGMGAPKEWISLYAHQPYRPWPHDVVITKPYYIQITEVTNAQYRKLVPKHVSKPLEGIAMDGDLLPVSSIAWFEAAEFLEKLSAQDPERRTYRLPTEAEWELAARAETTTTWPWGDEKEDAHEYERLRHEGQKPRSAVSPASYEPNPLGLYDMLGNVSEFTGGAALPFSALAVTDPGRPLRVEPQLESLFQMRIAKGGNFTHDPREVRTWFRFVANTWHRGYHAVGFRAVVPIELDTPKARTVPCEVRVLSAEDGSPLPIKTAYEVEHDKFRPLQDGAFALPIQEARDSYTWRLELPKDRRLYHDSYRHGLAYTYFDTPPFTKKIIYELPVFRRMSIEGRFASSDDEEGEHVIAWVAWIGARRTGRPSEPAVANGKGRFRIENVPWMPGVPMTVMAGSEAALEFEGAMAERTVVLPEKFKRVLKLGKALKSSEDVTYAREGTTSAIGIGGGVPPAKLVPEKAEVTGSLHLTCRLHDGTPLAGAVVVRGLNRSADAYPKGLAARVADLAVTTPTGTAHFPVVPAGEQTFELYAHGRPRGVKTFDIRKDQETTAEFALPEPATIRLRVLAPSGRPAGWAAYDLRSTIHRKWENVAPDGTQYVGKMCGSDGRALLHNVPPGPRKVYVRWLGHRVEQSVEPVAGETLDVTVRLKTP